MNLSGRLLKNYVDLNGKASTLFGADNWTQQIKVFDYLLRKGEKTLFGKAYDFENIKFSLNPLATFKALVPIHDYDTIYERWWKHTLNGEPNVCWPGKTKFFALSSGTSSDSSKRIPVTKAMLSSMRRSGFKQFKALGHYDLPIDFFKRGILMLGGCTDLNQKGNQFEGDLSGILAGKLPFFINKLYKPGKDIAQEKNWQTKLDNITANALDWDIGAVVGVPAWMQILFENIIQTHKVNNIHEVWPNLHFFVHGGVAFEPYKSSFEKLLGKPMEYMETYLASEGFLAYQNGQGKNSMELILNNGIFYEFIPFNEKNFDESGTVRPDAETFVVKDVQENIDYAIVITTAAGTWRYLLGDTVKFVDKNKCEIVITGRTRHYLSLCGEHLSVDNMNQAITEASKNFNIEIKEFTVAGIPFDNLFAHQWYIGTDSRISEQELKSFIDFKLKELNDDYAVERTSALKEISLKVLPTETFYNWMKINGKEGGQHKFPRVLKKEKHEEWVNYLRGIDSGD